MAVVLVVLFALSENFGLTHIIPQQIVLGEDEKMWWAFLITFQGCLVILTLILNVGKKS